MYNMPQICSLEYNVDVQIWIMDFSLQRPFALGSDIFHSWNFCSLELSLPELSLFGTFTPWKFYLEILKTCIKLASEYILKK